MSFISTSAFGFLRPTIKDTDYIRHHPTLGGQVPDDILQPDSDWRQFLPIEEQQAKSFDTYGCTDFGTLNQTETLHKRKFGFEKNWSDRAIGIMAGTYPPGNDPNNVYEALRKKGAVDEADLPFTDDITSVDQYYAPNPLPDTIIQKALAWGYQFKHEWLSDGQAISSASLVEALQHSPIGIAVDAWHTDGKFYIRLGKDCHWTTLVAQDKETGGWWIYDSYPTEKNLKLLAPDFQFFFAKRIWLEKIPEPVVEKKTPEKTPEEKVIDFFQSIVSFFRMWIKEVLR